MHLDFLKMIWLFPTFLLIHELEEWNILVWYKRNFRDHPENKTNRSTRFFLIFISIICFIWTAIATLPRSERIATIIMLPFILIVVQNCLQHIYWQILFKEYAPGIISAVILLLPTSLLILIRSFNEEFLPLWLALPVLAYWIYGLMETVKSKNTLPPSFQKINRFSNFMTAKLGLK